MAGSTGMRRLGKDAVAPRATTEPRWVRMTLTGLALSFLALFLLVPMVLVFYEGLRKGIEVYLAALVEPDAAAAIKLTLLTAAIAVPLNATFGVAAAWAIAKFEFRGKNLLITLIDLPFAVSPVIAGMSHRAAARSPLTAYCSRFS